MKRYIRSTESTDCMLAPKETQVKLRKQDSIWASRYYVTNRTSRYYVTNEDYIPLHAQPAEGYTKLQAIARAQREVREAVNLLGGSASEYTDCFHIVDENFEKCPELDRAI